MNSVIDELGYQGPILLSFITFTQLWNQTPYLIIYLVGWFINKYLNECLKYLFREPRPEPIDLKKAQERDLFRFFKIPTMDKNGVYISKAHLYGMPSGHAETSGYALTYYYLLKEKQITSLTSLPMNKSTIIFLIMLFVFIITIYQRWNSKAHSTAQLIMGTLVGGVTAGIILSTGTKYIRTKFDNIKNK